MSSTQQGKIGVNTQDLFPIIKKFLYSDHDIFLREIVSNAVDATQKLKVISTTSDFKGEVGDLHIRVKADKDAGTLTISDCGIGMTKEEVEKYINQIAFSGAEEFLEKYKENGQAIIGHFGLGFYSSFMVSKKVEIITKSYKDAPAVKWSCEGNTDYTLEETQKENRGTDIVMYLNEDDKEFLEPDKIKSILTKYCKFLPVPIIFGKEQEWKDGSYKDTEKDFVVNNTEPSWTKKPADLKEEDYSNFYSELYPMAEPPLFHIHLNVDYPFTLTGILYFPKIKQNLDIQKNKIQLYCNQVFITDSVEGIVPDYLTLLHGVIDSPDIPLNVSRSYLQSDRNVKKISSHITKKVADSLLDIFKTQREEYQKKWDDLKIFIQYGMLSDESFAERALPIVLLKNTESEYFTIEEYQEKIKGEQTDKDKKIVHLYTTDKAEQYSYIEKARTKGYDVLVMDGQLDIHFISLLEQKNPEHRFVRVDADVLDKLIPKEGAKSTHLSTVEQEDLSAVFESQLPKEGGMYMVNFEAMGEDADPVLITRSEWMRRMKEMANTNPGMNFYGSMGDQFTLAVNTDHKLVQAILADEKENLDAKISPLQSQIVEQEKAIAEINDLNKDVKPEDVPSADKERIEDSKKKIDEIKKEKQKLLKAYGKENKKVGQLIDLALLANGLLKGEALTKFVKRSVDLINA